MKLVMEEVISLGKNVFFCEILLLSIKLDTPQNCSECTFVVYIMQSLVKYVGSCERLLFN